MACIVNFTPRCCAHRVQRARTCNSTALQHGIGHCKAEAADEHRDKSERRQQQKPRHSRSNSAKERARLLLHSAACLWWRRGCRGQREVGKPQTN